MCFCVGRTQPFGGPLTFVCLQQKCQPILLKKNPPQWISYHVKEHSQITDWDSPLPWRPANKTHGFFIAQCLSSWQGSCLECQSQFCHVCHSCCFRSNASLGRGRASVFIHVMALWTTMAPPSCSHGVLAGTVHRMAVLTGVQRRRAGCSLVSLLLWNVPLVYTFATFSPVTVPLLKSLISSLNSLAERKDHSLPLFSLCEGRAACSVPSAPSARIEVLQVPA